MNVPLSPLTGRPVEFLFKACVLGKYDAAFFRCPESELIFTPEPPWLAEAYSSAITATDVGLVMRNLHNRDDTAWILQFLGLERGPYLDLGGGYGLFTRLMRDRGFDFHTTDPYCENIFAKTHEPAAGFTAEALTAFEVFEHIVNPLSFVEDAFKRYGARNLIFSTLTYNNGIPPRDWWYWCFETGQHISFYSPRTLALMAEKLGCHTFSLHEGFHVFCELPLTSFQKLVLSHRRVRRLYDRFRRRRGALRLSLTQPDYEIARGRVRAAQAGKVAEPTRTA
jgi:hypothetical protein